MRFEVTGYLHPETRTWADALRDVVVRHPNRGITPILRLQDGHVPVLFFELDANPSSSTDEIISPFKIIGVSLAHFPGMKAARAWIAAAWGCFLQHEALELVTVGDIASPVLDPHGSRERLNHTFHKGFPFALTRETLLEALTTAISRDEAMELMKEAP